jgi:hypothetical protein
VKPSFFFALFLAGLLATAPSVRAHAQEDSSQAPAARSWPNPEEVVAKLDSQLGLSDDQKAKITPIIADRQEKIKALAAENSGRRMQKMRKMKSIMSESDEKIKAVLTDEQKQKYTEMQQQMRDQARQRMRDRQAGGGSPQ